MRIVTTTAAVLSLRAVLDFVYVNYISTYFGGSFVTGAFPLDESGPFRMIESYTLVIVLAICLALSLYHRWRPSGVALVLYFTVVIIPLTSLYGLAGAPPAFVYAAAGSFLILIMVTGLLPKVKVARPGRDLLMIGALLCVGMGVYVYTRLLLTGGFERLKVVFVSVYDVRAEYVETGGPLMGYFASWQGYVLSPTLLCYGISRRKWWLAAVAVTGSVFLFGMTGMKSYVLAPALTGGIYFLWQKRYCLLYIFGGATILIIASYVLFLASGHHFAPSLLIRRLFFVPALVHVLYYDFFSQPMRPFVMLSNSIAAQFIVYPYELPVVELISWTYWGRDFHPNVGYLGDAFAHFGFMGMFLFSIILGLFLVVVDSVGEQLPGHLVAAVIAVPAMALTNSALFTSLLTHGLILAVVLLWLLRAVEEKRSILKSVREKQRTEICIAQSRMVDSNE